MEDIEYESYAEKESNTFENKYMNHIKKKNREKEYHREVKNSIGYNDFKYRNDKKDYNSRKNDPIVELKKHNNKYMDMIQDIDKRKSVRVSVAAPKKTNVKAEEPKGFWGFLSKKLGCGYRNGALVCSNFDKS